MMLMELELSWVQKPNGKLCPVDNAVLVIAPIPAGLLDTPFSIMRLAALFAIFFFAFGVFAGVGLAHKNSRLPNNEPTRLDPILEVPEDSEQPGPGPNPQLDPQAVNAVDSIVHIPAPPPNKPSSKNLRQPISRLPRVIKHVGVTPLHIPGPPPIAPLPDSPGLPKVVMPGPPPNIPPGLPNQDRRNSAPPKISYVRFRTRVDPMTDPGPPPTRPLPDTPDQGQRPRSKSAAAVLFSRPPPRPKGLWTEGGRIKPPAPPSPKKSQTEGEVVPESPPSPKKNWLKAHLTRPFDHLRLTKSQSSPSGNKS
ncbi:hypothetical protein AX14_002172 [Amanita brunnescens Koide BX004]|nr:hypothetical protein AX14_002172 [Amanita brunnescens Koide BX004]